MCRSTESASRNAMETAALQIPNGNSNLSVLLMFSSGLDSVCGIRNSKKIQRCCNRVLPCSWRPHCPKVANGCGQSRQCAGLCRARSGAARRLLPELKSTGLAACPVRSALTPVKRGARFSPAHSPGEQQRTRGQMGRTLVQSPRGAFRGGVPAECRGGPGVDGQRRLLRGPQRPAGVRPSWSGGSGDQGGPSGRLLSCSDGLIVRDAGYHFSTHRRATASLGPHRGSRPSAGSRSAPDSTP